MATTSLEGGVRVVISVSLQLPLDRTAIQMLPAFEEATGPIMQNVPVQLTAVGAAPDVEGGSGGSVAGVHEVPSYSRTSGIVFPLLISQPTATQNVFESHDTAVISVPLGTLAEILDQPGRAVEDEQGCCRVFGTVCYDAKCTARARQCR